MVGIFISDRTSHTDPYNDVTGTFLHHRHMHSLLVLQRQTQHSSTHIILDTVEAHVSRVRSVPSSTDCSLKNGKYLLFKSKFGTKTQNGPWALLN